MAGLNLLITGRPGVGKTTLVMNVVERLRASVRLAGFTTAEVRGPSGERTGFQILTVEGKQGELARAGFRSSVRVGRYGVNLEAFERLALPELARRNVDLIVIDEIGKMECASDRFRHTVKEALDAQVSVLATLGIARLPFLESLRSRPDVELLTLTERNRNALVLELCRRFDCSPHLKTVRRWEIRGEPRKEVP
jgi:nucleoside-triphosphatase